MVYKSKKIPRVVRDRNRRIAVKRNDKMFAKIIREEPPKGSAKIVAREEMIKDPQTGKAKLQTVYEVKKEKNPHIKQNLLYIPKVPPEKERKYLRKELPQFKNAPVRYPNVDKYGDLKSIKKNRLIEIAKNEYDLPDKLQKEFNKGEIIRFMKDRSEGKIKSVHDYLPNKVRLAKIEPVRDKPILYQVDPLNPLQSRIKYGNKSLFGNQKKSAFESMNQFIQANPKWRNIPLFGSTRKMDETIYQKFKSGTAGLDEVIGEIMLHIDLPDEERLKLTYLDKDQAEAIYKKMYKESLKPDSEKFNKPIRLPEFKMHNTPHLSKAPMIKDTLGKSHVVGTVPFPEVINPLFSYSTLAPKYKKIGTKNPKLQPPPPGNAQAPPGNAQAPPGNAQAPPPPSSSALQLTPKKKNIKNVRSNLKTRAPLPRGGGVNLNP